MSGKNKQAAMNLAAQLPAGNAAPNAPVVPCAQNNDPTLKVRVFATVKGKRQYVQATVTASTLTGTSAAVTGIADFSYVKVGTYAVAVTALVAPDDQTFYVPAGPAQQVTLAKGDKGSLDLEVKPINVVTPKLEAEYLAVLFDRDLAQHQTAAGEPASDLLRPDPTYVQVSLSCSETAPAYTGDGTLAAANCTVFLDAACTQALGARKLTHAELTAAPPTKLYLRGTTRGAFALTLTLDPSATPGVKVEPPATLAMGVVQTELEVRQHATAVNVSAATYPLTGYCADLENANLIPAQVAMSDDDKVTKGRLLHQEPSGKADHSRAMILVKVTGGEWPAGTDDYLVVLEATPANLRVYDAETKGKRQKLPLKLKVRDLKAANKTLWVEGAKESDAIRDIRLSLALDRDSGGLAKSQKANGDWARFTVVKIDSVKLEYTAPAAGQPQPWNASKKRWYINYQAGDPGRTVTIRARLGKPIAGVKLHFMLSPDKDNLKEDNWGIDLPAAWTWGTVGAAVKQKDKVNATDLLHKSEDTDAQGQADCDLVLSQFGGDQFTPAAYIAQDPHLAAYVNGHDTLADRKPKLADDPIKVWRKFAYQKIKVESRKFPSTKTAEDAYGRVRADMFKRPSVKKTTAQVQALALPSLMPEYMFKVGGHKTRLALNVSDANQSQFFGLATTDGEHPISVPLITCDFNWAEERNSAAVVVPADLAPDAFPRNINTNLHVCDPPLQGGALIVSGDWIARDWDATANGGAGAWVNPRNGTLAAGDVDIDPKRADYHAVRIKLPAGVGATTGGTRITITNLVVQGALNHYLGGYDIDNASQAIVAVFDPKDTRDYQNTVIHELGHAFHQTNGNAPAPGIPGNPNYLNTPTGGHCGYDTDKCVMFTAGPIAGSLNRYCPDCHPYMLVQDMSALS